MPFEDLCKLAELAGFEQMPRGSSSHVKYKHPAIREAAAAMCNFQNFSGKAKPYQVRQLLEKIDEYGLEPDREVQDDG